MAQPVSPASQNADDGVQIRDGESGTALLHRLLREAATEWPESVGEAGPPAEAARFRKNWPRAVVDFEAARVASDARAAIGAHVVTRAGEALVLRQGAHEQRLGDALATRDARPFGTRTVTLQGSGRLEPRVPYGGRTYRGPELRDLMKLLHDRAALSEDAVAAVHWLLDHATDAAGEIDLAGRRFAVMGAAAELAPTPLLLEAGAEVLFVDRVAVPESLPKDSTLSGRIVATETPTDLLADPCSVAATLRAYAEDGPVDFALYAYAPGRGREWRLVGAMNALVDAMPAGAVRSVSMLVSPTSPVVLTPDSRARAEARGAQAPAWQRAMERVGLLPPGQVGEGDLRVLRTLVSIQGAGYQTAQYVGKVLAAERFARTGPSGQNGPVPVSANTAAITMTRSLQHPVFEAAFLGAAAFGVEAFDPETTRWLNGLLLLHDLLNPDAQRGEIQRRQVHGGMYTVPWEIEPAVRAAAVLGLAKRPALVAGLLGRR